MKESDSYTRHGVSFGIPEGEMWAEKERGVMIPESEGEASYTTEFRAYNDDAWYSVLVTMQGKETLRIRYHNFTEEQDNLFQPSDFQSLEELEEFQQRFRPVSKQLQDTECRQLVQGIRVCACHYFSHDDVRFYDAVVDGVEEREHSRKKTEEECRCTFILFWLHGPNAQSLTNSTIESICVVQHTLELDPVVASFLKMARERIEFTSSRPISVSKGVSGLEMVAYSNKGSETAHRLGFFERMQKEKRRAKRSVVGVCSPEVSCKARRIEDSDLGGIKNVFMILIGNLERELCSSIVAEFLYRHTSVSATVFMFPSLSSEIYTRGAIMLDSVKNFQKLDDFLNNPNHIITSSTGRPWVIIEKLVGLKNIKASIGTLVPISKNVLQNGKNVTSCKLKVVFSGTKEFKIANDMRDLFIEFFDHQQRLHKKLELLERRIFAARSFDELS